jgi:hypothetical protein
MSSDMNTKPIFERTTRIGKWRVTFVVLPGDPPALLVEWDPEQPMQCLSGSQMRQYRRARAEAIAALADYMGGTVACVEMAPTDAPTRTFH